MVIYDFATLTVISQVQPTNMEPLELKQKDPRNRARGSYLQQVHMAAAFAVMKSSPRPAELPLRITAE